VLHRLHTANRELGIAELAEGVELAELVGEMRNHRLFVTPADIEPEWVRQARERDSETDETTVAANRDRIVELATGHGMAKKKAEALADELLGVTSEHPES